MAKTMTGVEIFAEGTWNNRSFSAADLDAMAQSFDTLGLAGRVPLKLGHEGPDSRDEPESQFALGWVTKVYRQGKRLLCDWEVPDAVHKWIDEGLLRHVSVELLKDVQAGTRTIAWVLDAIALLGSDQPAVGILKNLKESMSRRALHSAHGGMVAFARVGVINHSTGDRKSMSDDLANKVAELAEKLTKQQDEITAVKSENRKLASANAELVSFKTETEKNAITSHRAAIAKLFEDAIKSDDIQPSTRERFNRLHAVDDDVAVMRLKLADVEGFIKGNPNPFKKVVAKSEVISLARSTDELPEGTAADEEMALRVDAYCRETYGDDDAVKSPDKYAKAVIAVFKRHPQLAQRYKDAVLVKAGRV